MEPRYVPVLRRHLAIGAALILSLAVVGCDKLPSSLTMNQRFEFAKDDSGRLVRLNRFTGELKVVEDEMAAQQAASPRRPAKTSPKTTPTPLDAALTPTSLENEVPIAQELHADVAAVARVDAGCPPQDVLLSSTHIKMRSDAPAFVAPREMPEAVATMTAGSVLPVVEVRNEWVLVQFEDPRWGPRVGYIHCTHVSADTDGALDAPTTTRASQPARPAAP
jgi:hypothetical protein